MSFHAPIRIAALGDATPPPCFYWQLCRGSAALEKGGKSVCRRCATTMRGQEFPLRSPTRRPLYLTGRDAAEAMEMIESNHKRRNRSKRGEKFS